MSASHKDTLAAVFADARAPSALTWTDVEALMVALGGTISAGADGRLRVTLHGRRGSFQTTGPDLSVGATLAVRDLLRRAQIRPEH